MIHGYVPQRKIPASQEELTDARNPPVNLIVGYSDSDEQRLKESPAEYKATLLEQVQTLFGKLQACRDFSEEIGCSLLGYSVEDSKEPQVESVRYGIELCHSVIDETLTRLKNIRDSIKFYNE